MAPTGQPTAASCDTHLNRPRRFDRLLLAHCPGNNAKIGMSVFLIRILIKLGAKEEKCYCQSLLIHTALVK